MSSSALVVGPDKNGRRVAIVDGVVAREAPADAPVLSCAEGEIGPGNVCAHTHIYSALAPYGMPKPEPAPETFIQILERVWWRLDRAIDAETLRAGARDYVAKALLAGTTTLIDHHESPNLIEGSLAILSDVCTGLGMRAVLCFGATERNFGRDEALRGLAENRTVVPSPLIRGMVGLHASFTVSDETIAAAGDLARSLGTAVHVHVAEDVADVDDAKRRGFAGPLERLIALGALVPGSLLAHGVHLDAAQVRLAARNGAWFVQNPRSNEGNRVGYAGNLSQVPTVALGVDGWNPDMAEEQAALARLAQENGDAAAAGPRAATRLAAGHALMAERFGLHPEPLAVGAAGDVVVRRDGAVEHVVVAGRPVVLDGHLVGGDPAAFSAAARAEAARLWDRLRNV
ncbi:amidohydrolase family protein [Rhodoplanes sp. TEM]|uniref:amidohydrolase family protein n=1 Tax=Rhodoplanes TaxID=29407 RepID=UPI0023505A54|nr:MULTISPECIES: amidohydrolase family protein [Rhodoplanes]MDC7987659.1 amidohydrolase family protein [Rhodoplanes sp. TEM]MDQ0358049.1 cytosine/adenosine deaminase-related metal-dependent hydrolase [Rhodoplanes tepidamans]